MTHQVSTTDATTPRSNATGVSISRRRALGGATAAIAGAAALAACGSDDSGSSSDTTAGSGSGGGSALAQTSQVPVGGGVVVKSEKVVVTQPSAGEFKAFSAVCPHQGCLVSDITGGKIICPCHGSEFSVDDGHVITGPATSGLRATQITVTGDAITVA
ncbi:hypothetical protein GCM10027169_02660 [Gordonia jinhuaensis]|uniref:Cytochrome bc1 complex Rieske iron-sulfur subunit n=1 Tax=Gordonia jinhuaensis TaxID=1517702 RepID=A0A916T574_9ACTN|nr:Rieske (2Fe-2S) protein [Gordonia jinhuaensis]GGB28741.1 hypothetical protein GCM10011489_16200 [Gordonia jinhuaensis]